MLALERTLLGTLAISLLGKHTAGAQSATNAPTSASGDEGTTRGAVIDEIVVTAQRKVESLQDVPISVNAVTAQQLEARGIDNAFELGRAVPGLVVSRTGTTTTPYLRGVGSNAANPNNEASVATYIDGIYIAAPYGSVYSFNNIERIEVLKGPQGTLFGRNATGGVIQIATRKPSHDPSLDMSVGYGNYETYSAGMYGTTGVSETVAVDLAVNYKNQQDGFGRNLTTGTDTYDGYELATRSKLLFTPSSGTEVIFAGDYQRSRYANLNYVFPEGVLGLDGISVSQGRYDTRGNQDDTFRSEQYGASLTINHDLGFAQLVSLTSRRIAKGLNRFDSDNTPLTVVHFNTPQDVRTWTQEVQLLAPADSPVDWTLGAFYFNNKAAYDPARLIGTPFGGELDIFGRQHTKSASVYGQATFKVLPATAVTVGLRYTDEKQELDQAVGPPGAMLPLPGDTNKFDKFTWRLAVNQDFTDHVSAYVSYNRGIKSGGFDLLGPGAPPFKPEILDAYEIGLKSELLDQRIRLNLAAYYYDYQDIQVSSNPQGTIVTNNAASAKVKGAEAELEFAVTRQLRIFAGANVMDGEYGDYPNPTIFPPSPFDPPVSLANADGQDMVRTPKFTGNLSVMYALESPVGTFDLAASAFHSSKFYWDVDNRLDSPEYTVYSASVTWRSRDQKFDIKLWGENLTDKKYLITGVPNANGDSIQYAAPRTYGITLGAHF